MQTSSQSHSTPSAFRVAATLLSLAALTFAFTLGTTPASAETQISWSWGNGKTIRGSGNVVEQAVAIAAFDNIVVQDGIRVVLRRGAVQKVLVKTDDNLLAMVEAKVDGSRLLLRMQPKISMSTKSGVVVTIDYTALNALRLVDGARGELDAASGSTFRATVKDGASLTIAEANAQEFELSVSDGAKATVEKGASLTSQRYKVADGARLSVASASSDSVAISVADGASATINAINVKRIDASVSDGAHIDLAGVAKEQNFSLADGSSIDALRLQGASAHVRAVDGSALKLGVVQTLNAEMADGGSVRYAGDPTVTMNNREGGSIRKI